MPRYHRVLHPGHLQFITSSTYRRVPVFVGRCFCQISAEVLGKLRREFRFRLVGWVVMLDHFHLLIQPWRRRPETKGLRQPAPRGPLVT